MDLDRLKVVALRYFENKVGKAPDVLCVFEVNYKEPSCAFEALLGDKQYMIQIAPTSDFINLTELLHHGFFADAAALAGYDKELKDIE